MLKQITLLSTNRFIFISAMKYINFSESEQILETVDTVLFDIDGVLLHSRKVLPGSVEYVQKVRKLGKSVGFVTNAGIYTIDAMMDRLRLFDPTEEEIVSPNNSFVFYLKQTGFKKDIYTVCSTVTKNILRETGFKIIEFKDINDNLTLEEDPSAILSFSKKSLHVCRNVGAVLIDFDFRSGLPDLQVAHVLLNHLKDVLLMCGARDDTAPMGDGLRITGPKYYIDSLERLSNKQCVQLAKPDPALKDVLVPMFNIKDDKRVLFIGDSVATDIAFGANCGFQTLLLLSGDTTKEAVDKWKFPEHHRPDYVADSLKELVI